MAKSNAERQAKWRNANRALFNFRRRCARKAKGANTSCPEILSSHPGVSNALPTVQPASGAKSKIEELRELISEESQKPIETLQPVPRTLRDDYGRPISEIQWKRLQERKAMAKDSGYELDEYSQ